MAYQTHETHLPEHVARLTERLNNQIETPIHELTPEDFNEDEREFTEMLRFRFDRRNIAIEIDASQRGTVSDATHVGEPCTGRHLETILNIVHAAKFVCLLGNDSLYHDLEETIKKTDVELSRLQQHPDLFATAEHRKYFWMEVLNTYRSIRNKKATSIQDVDSCHSSELEKALFKHDESSLPSRVSYLKPWEQLLYNQAPGSGITFSSFVHPGSCQVFPMSAMRIAMSEVREQRDIVRGIEASRRKRDHHGGTPLSLGTEMPMITSEGHSRSYHSQRHLMARAIAGSFDAPKGYRDPDLATLNLDFHRLHDYNPYRRLYGGAPQQTPGRRDWNNICTILEDNPFNEGDSL